MCVFVLSARLSYLTDTLAAAAVAGARSLARSISARCNVHLDGDGYLVACVLIARVFLLLFAACLLAAHSHLCRCRRRCEQHCRAHKKARVARHCKGAGPALCNVLPMLPHNAATPLLCTARVVPARADKVCSPFAANLGPLPEAAILSKIIKLKWLNFNSTDPFIENR